MSRTCIVALLLLATPFLVIHLSNYRHLEGSVHTGASAPAGGASVGFQGQRPRTHSDENGRFRLPSGHGRVTATRPGYRIGWASADFRPLQITLTLLPANDNDDYAWIAPGPDAASPNNCANCHQDIHREWAASAHAKSARNPKFLALLTGSDGKSAPRRDWNLQAGQPDGAGVCVKCHAPTFHDPTLEYDFLSLKGVAGSGVHCDYCHKIAAAPTDKLGIRFGRDGYPLLRPQDGDLLTFGPLDDAVRPGESFAHAPFYKESSYCASCHEGIVFGVHAYATYSEWLESPARRAGLQCQSCHMAPTGAMANLAPGQGGVERAPETLASHALPGGAADMLRKCLQLEVAAHQDRKHTTVTTSLRTDHVGHRVPTGFIDRHLVLIVEARGAHGEHVAVATGPKLDTAAGPALAGQAGRLYAKRLHGANRSPLPFWVTPDGITDTRLRPLDTDRQVFSFPGAVAVVRVRVLYRRFWPETAEPFQWADNEVVVVDRSIKLAPN